MNEKCKCINDIDDMIIELENAEAALRDLWSIVSAVRSDVLHVAKQLDADMKFDLICRDTSN